jgi:hypothetical protein
MGIKKIYRGAQGKTSSNKSGKSCKKRKIQQVIKDKLEKIKCSNCVIILRQHNDDVMNLNGIIMKEIPQDYKSLSYKTIAIMDKDTNEIVVIISFSPFKKMSKEKYEEFEDITKTFWKMKDQINPITNNKSMVGGIMYALGLVMASIKVSFFFFF